ncbi:EAL and HDOD domain-containing protein [Cellulomonas sp. KRMCY2]|uniref:EAL and HDOD domain-containing protein n=1 Tax=Cellulomonas sp. KRMCY2 TaxID=1304865 RepID=UPI0018CBF8D0|nr:HDOD domain-containing protein [Cellulomonas sp. KRMCY2]
MGRQPIYDTSLDVMGHELLFRAEESSQEAGPGMGDAATTTVILNTFTAFGLDQLVGDRLAFVNVTRPFILGTMPMPFSPSVVVLEVVENVAIDAEVHAGVLQLAADGFAFALDDFLWDQHDRVPLLPYASYVKVDISQVAPDELGPTVARLGAYDALLVAERVETAEDLRMCQDLGFDLFQGYYLLRPETLSAVTLNPEHLACIKLLQKLADPAMTVEGIELLVQRDAALTYRVLHAANAAATGLRRRLTSVRDALVMLGTQRLRAWVILLVAADAGGGSPEQLTAAVVRARTCEILAPTLRLSADVAFTAGLLSRLDVVLGVPLPDVLGSLSLSDELGDALLRSSGPLGDLLTAVRSYEAGSTSPAIPSTPDLTDAYLAAVAWATRALADLQDPQPVH